MKSNPSKPFNILSDRSGSLTVEAVLSLSLFLFASVLLMLPFLVLHHQQQITKTLEDSAKTISKVKYFEHYRSAALPVKVDAGFFGESQTILSSLYLEHELKLPLVRELDLITDSKITEDSILYVANYSILLPFSVFGLNSLPQKVIVSRRPFIGADGERWKTEEESEEESEDPLVYYGISNSGTYHEAADCSYFVHDIHAVTGIQIKELRTPSGARYQPCARCHPDSHLSLVYYTTGSRSYHRTKNCSSMNSYIQSIHKSDAIAMGKHPCHRCSA